MGYELRRWLADRLPADISTGERLVALEIADQANDQTRRAYGRGVLPIVVRRTGYASDKQVGKVLGKLAARGIELRVQLVKDGAPFFDALGRPVFACEGQETTYRIPNEAECPALLVPQSGDDKPLPTLVPPAGEQSGTSPDLVPPAGDQSGPPPGTGWSPAGALLAPQAGPSGPPSGGPFSSESPQDSSSLLSGAGRHIATATGATVEETREMISIIKTENRPRSLSAYVATLAANGDLEALLARVRSGAKASGPSSSTPIPPSYREVITLPPCPHGMPGGDQGRPGTGTPACPQCRTANAAPAATQRHDPKPAGRPDLTSLRATLASLKTVRGPGLHAPTIQAPPVVDEPSADVQAAHAYLARRGDAHRWTTAARDKLGSEAKRGEVLLLAAELARLDEPDRVGAAR